MRKTVNKEICYILIVLVLILCLFAVRTYRQYNILRTHIEHFRQPNPEIEPWMTVSLVAKQFGIPEDEIFQELNTTKKLSHERLTLDGICKKNHLNCTDVINKIEMLKTR